MLHKSLFAALTLGLVFASSSASAQDATADLQIEASVSNACQINGASLTGLEFEGTSDSSGTNLTFVVLCNAGTSYAVSVGEGLSFGLGNHADKRHLADGQGNFIPYELTQGSTEGGAVWGSDADAISGVGTGGFVDHPFFVRFSDLSLAPGGTYSDTAVLTVTYN